MACAKHTRGQGGGSEEGRQTEGAACAVDRTESQEVQVPRLRKTGHRTEENHSWPQALLEVLQEKDLKDKHPSGLPMAIWNWPFKTPAERAKVMAWNRKQERKTKQDNLNNLGEALW
jgi:hypothetical protein